MELTELENIIKEYDKKIALNRDVLKSILSKKPDKHLRIERLKAMYQLCSPLLLPCLIALVIEVMNIKISFTYNFYIGIGLFIPVFIFVWSLNIKHYLLMREISFLTPITSVKKQVAKLERYSIWMTKIRNILMPFLIIGMLLIFVPQSAYRAEFIILIILIVSVFIASAFYRNHSVRERYMALKEQIEAIEELER